MLIYPLSSGFFKSNIMNEVFFNGNAGRIEGRYHKSRSDDAPLALVLHPHPQYGGNMNNKVVYYTYKAFANNDFSVLRINYRGVGNSTGTFDRGIGELGDAAVAVDWLQNTNPNSSSLWVAGFSFGAWIAMQLMMRRPEIESFIAISPPANKYDFSFLSPCPVPGLIVQGNQDSISEEESVKNLATKISSLIKNNKYFKYQVIQGADHFFRDHMSDITRIVNDYIRWRVVGGDDCNMDHTFNQQELEDVI